MKQFFFRFYLVVLAMASLLAAVGSVAGMTGCGSSGNTGGGGTPPPQKEVSIVIAGQTVMARHVRSSNYQPKVTVTVKNTTDTTSTCSMSGTVNIATVDGPTCAVTPSDDNSGAATVVATANADTTKTAKLDIQVGAWMLLEGPYGTQFYDGDGKGSPITIFTHDQILSPTNGCFHASTQRDLSTFVCLNAWSTGPSVINVYKTDGTAGGTTQVGAPIDLSSIGQVTFPSLSSDGKKILFVVTKGGVDNMAHQSIWIMNTDGTAKVDLFDEIPSNIGMEPPQFAPDDLSVTFYNLEDNMVWIMGVDGKTPHQLLTVNSLIALYSNDATKNLYYSDFVATYVFGNPNPLYPGYRLRGISPDNKNLLLTNIVVVGDVVPGQTFVAPVTGGQDPVKIGNGGWGTWRN